MKLTREEENKIIAAIQAAEQKTSGEIRVHIAKKINTSVYEEACQTFEKLGMAATQERNGILIFLAPTLKQFSVIGDIGIHQKVGANFWNAVRDAMQDDFKKSDFVKGLQDGVTTCGTELAKYFPRNSDDRNELADSISR